MARTVMRRRRADAAVPAEWIAPQLTQLVEAAPDGDQWHHEINPHSPDEAAIISAVTAVVG